MARDRGLLGLPRGSEVIVPSFTWVACAHAVVLAGSRPVFCDARALRLSDSDVDRVIDAVRSFGWRTGGS